MTNSTLGWYIQVVDRRAIWWTHRPDRLQRCRGFARSAQLTRQRGHPPLNWSTLILLGHRGYVAHLSQATGAHLTPGRFVHNRTYGRIGWILWFDLLRRARESQRQPTAPDGPSTGWRARVSTARQDAALQRDALDQARGGREHRMLPRTSVGSLRRCSTRFTRPTLAT